ncbi:MAG: phosphatase PAP2 family protein [Bacteroidia bacterium]|nr:phosphatase PAP2 family protein [Bacteroidia bacterium]
MNTLTGLVNKVLNLSFVKSFAVKFPSIYQISVNRFSLKSFDGLPLTILLTIFAVNLAMFNELAENIENSQLVLSIDNYFATVLFRIRIDSIAEVFYYFSKVGSTPIVLLIALTAIAVFYFRKMVNYIFPLLLTMIGTSITMILSKTYFHRIRPIDLGYYKETMYSFPSGHAMFAISFYGLLFYVLIRQAPKHRLQWFIFAISFILLIGFSRLYLCVHFLSDVIAGYSLGLLWLLLSISIIEFKKFKSIDGM